MNHYQTTVNFHSNTEEVYEAITTTEGIKSWWTIDCEVSTEVGGKSSFYFERLLFNSMEIRELSTNQKVRWKCVEGWNEWLGTEVVFTLSENNSGGTDLIFEHIGLNPDLKCFKMCSQGWGKTLQSLKNYVDKGEGTPHIPKKGIAGILSRTAFKLFSRNY